MENRQFFALTCRFILQIQLHINYSQLQLNKGQDSIKILILLRITTQGYESPYVDCGTCKILSQATCMYTLIHACTGLYTHVHACTCKCLRVDMHVLHVALNLSLTCTVCTCRACHQLFSNLFRENPICQDKLIHYLIQHTI